MAPDVLQVITKNAKVRDGGKAKVAPFTISLPLLIMQMDEGAVT